MRLKGKTAIITGASRGIGRSTALLFAKEGAKVVVNYLSNKEAADSLVERIRQEFGGEALAIQGDISKPEDVSRLFAESQSFLEKIDIVVANAGTVIPKNFLDQTVEDWRKTIDINMVGQMLIAQHASRIMLSQRSGKIIFTSSMRGLFEYGRPGVMDYCMSKAAVISLTKNLAKELAPDICVNSVAPGFTDTDLATRWDDQTREAAVKDVYLKRLMTPEDIAEAFLYLAADSGNALTGQVLVVDGGYSLK